MKKCIFSAIVGAITMLAVLIGIANIRGTKEQKRTDVYEHIDYVSGITEAECYVCSDSNGDTVSAYWGEDNVGIINLNTFDVIHLEINRYSEHGERIEEPAGVMLSCGITDKESDIYVHAYCFPDNAYASVQITGVKYAIDRDLIQRRLCQKCIDSINDLWFLDQPPAEYAIISFEDRTIQPLLNTYAWFSAGNYGIDCEFKDSGTIALLIHYCPNRYL